MIIFVHFYFPFSVHCYIIIYIKPPFYSVKLVCNNNLQKRGSFYDKLLRIYYYKIEKTLEKMIILSTTS